MKSNVMKTTNMAALLYILSKSRALIHAAVLTSDARIDPPIQALNLRSRVVLLAINFKRILCEHKQYHWGCAAKRLIKSTVKNSWDKIPQIFSVYFYTIWKTSRNRNCWTWWVSNLCKQSWTRHIKRLQFEHFIQQCNALESTCLQNALYLDKPHYYYIY